MTRYLFNAKSEEEANSIKVVVEKAINSLRTTPIQDNQTMIGMDYASSMAIAAMIEIGEAPNQIELPNVMRSRANSHGSVKIALTKAYAEDLANKIEIGLMRHVHGVFDPSQFKIH